MVRIARITCCLCVATAVLVSAAAMGQTPRVQFGSMVDGPEAAPGAAPATPPMTSPNPSPAPALAPGPDPMAAGAAPMATLGGPIQPAPTWDPYATPPAGSGAVLPAGPYLDWGNPAASVAQLQKFRVETRADYHYFAPEGSNPLGFNQIELSTTLAIPVLKSKLLITPGFATYFWQGPNSKLPPPAPADMPADTFDAYLDAAWNPHINDRFSGELSLRGGLYSDFRGIDEDSIRLTGTALAVMQINQVTQLKLGIWYLNRVQYKILPTFGVVWSPNDNVRFDILFPNPKYSQRLNAMGGMDWWWYLSGDYGGDAWTIRRGKEPGTTVGGQLDEVDYNDIRIALGLEFKRPGGLGLSGLFEIGGAFDRHLDYASGEPGSYAASSTVFLRGSLAF